MEKLDDLLEINNLKIYQNRNWFSFSLDSVILGSCINIPLRSKKILDLCTGNAPVPLILSTRTKAHIDAVEYQKDVYDLAIESVNYNKLDDQINIINDDFNNYAKECESDIYDLITCNPPYFVDNFTKLYTSSFISVP
jgi:tRNA1(Val) A37 N6-methylase TrmN6